MPTTIPTQPAFYKQDTSPAEYWSVALHKVTNENYELLIEDHDQYTYPVDGWNYFATPPQGFLDWVIANTPEE